MATGSSSRSTAVRRRRSDPRRPRGAGSRQVRIEAHRSAGPAPGDRRRRVAHKAAAGPATGSRPPESVSRRGRALAGSSRRVEIRRGVGRAGGDGRASRVVQGDRSTVAARNPSKPDMARPRRRVGREGKSEARTRRGVPPLNARRQSRRRVGVRRDARDPPRAVREPGVRRGHRRGRRAGPRRGATAGARRPRTRSQRVEGRPGALKLLFDKGTPAPLPRRLADRSADTPAENGGPGKGNGWLPDLAEREQHESS